MPVAAIEQTTGDAMSKHKSFLLPAALMLAALPAAFGSPVISVQTGPLGAGQTFTASIAITGVTGLYAFQFDLGFSRQVINALSITEGAFLPSGGSTFFIPGSINNAGGTITFTADSLLGSGPGVSGSGVLANVLFRGAGQGISPISISNAVALDPNLNPIVIATTDGQSPQIVPEPAGYLLGMS